MEGFIDRETIGILVSDIIDLAEDTGANLLELHAACTSIASASRDMLLRNAADALGDGGGDGSA